MKEQPKKNVDTMEQHHENMKKMPKAQTKVKPINDARLEEVKKTI